MKLTRRSVLQGTAGALAAGGLAGCLDDVASGANGVDSGYAAFFSLWDWSQEVGGDEVDFENPVPIGEMGHGWEPEGDLIREFASSDAFVYLDSPEFSWAQDAAATLEADYDGIAVIDVLDGLEADLLDWDHEGGADRDEGDGHSHDDEHDHEEGDDHSHEEGDDHDHGNIDPHVWVDPVLAQDLVSNIADGLADADPDAADTFADNADAYNDRLASVDEEFQALVEAADRDVGVLAGHNSYQYLEVRYGFELHSPIGVSPQDDPSHDEISGTIELIEDEGIDTILYDRFAAPSGGDLPPLAATILEDSSASDATPVTPIEGTLRKWADEGWGYVEQMQEINLPAFRGALGAQ